MNYILIAIGVLMSELAGVGLVAAALYLYWNILSKC